MDRTLDGHVTEVRLEQLFLGALEETQAERAMAHLEICELCQEQAEQKWQEVRPGLPGSGLEKLSSERESLVARKALKEMHFLTVLSFSVNLTLQGVLLVFTTFCPLFEAAPNAVGARRGGDS
jgi:hypothetical protein